MIRQFIKDGVMWGTILWLFGYVLGIILFVIVPPAILGWIIMPIGILVTLWVLMKKISAGSFHYYLFLGVVWALIAIVFDYLFLVMLFKPADGYYKLDVYLYYLFALTLPLLVGLKKMKSFDDNKKMQIKR